MNPFSSQSSQWNDMVTVTVGLESFQVHKKTLFSNSKILKSMSNPIVLELEPEVFRTVLKLLYEEPAPERFAQFDLEFVDQLLSASDKYQILPLKSIIETYLLTKINQHTVLRLLLLSGDCHCSGLKASCIKYIHLYSSSIRSSESWGEFLNNQENRECNSRLLDEIYRDLASKNAAKLQAREDQREQLRNRRKDLLASQQAEVYYSFPVPSSYTQSLLPLFRYVFIICGAIITVLFGGYLFFRTVTTTPTWFYITGGVLLSVAIVIACICACKKNG